MRFALKCNKIEKIWLSRPTLNLSTYEVWAKGVFSKATLEGDQTSKRYVLDILKKCKRLLWKRGRPVTCRVSVPLSHLCWGSWPHGTASLRVFGNLKNCPTQRRGCRLLPQWPLLIPHAQLSLSSKWTLNMCIKNIGRKGWPFTLPQQAQLEPCPGPAHVLALP